MKQKAVIVSDLQYPYIDKRVFKAFLDFVWAQDDITDIVINGDVYDFYDLSKYDKNPARCGNLTQELRGLQTTVFAPLREAAPSAKMWILEGNHEDRLRKFIWHHAPELSGVKGLSVPELYKCEDFGIEYLPMNTPLMFGHLMVMHGHLVRTHSGMTARAHFDRHGTSIMTGHSHRLGVFYKTDVRGTHGAWEIGCLCSLTPEYDPYPNWQQGWAVVTAWPNRLFNVELVPVINRRVFVYGGREWKV